MRLPTRICFPFGYAIRVRQVTRAQMAKVVGTDAEAGWTCGARVIYLLKDRTEKQKRADLAHEMLHAVADFGNYVLTNGMGEL